MTNIHDLAREYLAKDGLKIRNTQKAGVFLFSDWLLANGYAAQPIVQADGLNVAPHLHDFTHGLYCPICGIAEF